MWAFSNLILAPFIVSFVGFLGKILNNVCLFYLNVLTHDVYAGGIRESKNDNLLQKLKRRIFLSCTITCMTYIF